MAVADDVLAAQQHLQGRALDMVLDDAQALPGVFVEEAQAGVERGAAPALQRVVADLVDLLEDRHDVGGAHAGGPQRLVGVAQGGVGDPDASGSHACLLVVSRRE